MKKRILSLVLTLVLILSLVPAPAIAVYDTAAVGDCTITSQPKDVTVNPGQTATFTVAATNPDSTNLKYLWFDADKVNVDDLDYKDLSAAIDKIKAAKLGEGKTLRLTNVTEKSDGLRVRCAVYYEKTVLIVTVPKDLTFSSVAVLHVNAKACDEHTLSFVPATEATCATEGNLPYYRCSVCGRCYLDEEAKYETTVAECTIAVLNTHAEVVHVDASVPTCAEAGLKEHYTCLICGKLFSDAEGKTEISADSIELAKDPANHTDLAEVTAKSATCCEKGNVHHWYCDGCGKYYSDAEGKTEMKRSETELDKDPANHTNLIEHKAKAASCTAPGNIRYWYCDGCGNYYSDAAGKNEIKKSDTVLNQLKHDYQWIAISEDGVEYHARKCSMCGGLTDTGSHTGGTAYCSGKAVCETCNFEYGKTDANTHINTELRNFVAPTPDSEGYSGDLCCLDCGVLVQKGHVTDRSCAHVLSKVEAKEATCQEEGNIEYWRCERCNVRFSDENGENEISADDTVIAKVSHSYVWKTTALTHQRVCKWCEAAQPLFETPKAHTMSGAEPTCHSGDYCLICGYDDGQRDPSKHDGGTEVRGAYEPQDGKPGYTGDTYCLGCGEITQHGRQYYTACPGGCASTLYYVAGTPRTCYEDGVKEHFVCTVCGNMYLDAKATVPTDEAGIVDKCTGHELHPGKEAISAKSLMDLIKSSGFTDLTMQEVIEIIKNATSGGGISGSITIEDFLKNVHMKDIDHCHDDEYHWLGCQLCGKTLADLRPEFEENGIIISDVWYEIGAKEAHSGGVASCKEKAICTECGDHYGALSDHRYDVVVTPASCTKGGYTTHVCNICNEKYISDETPAKGHSIVKGKCTDCGQYFQNPFYDVSNKDRFYTAVMWAYTFEPQITSGVTDNYFKPYDSCTRGQVVTFLWRAAGRPEPKNTTNAFSDVSSTGRCAPYYTAILWAAEQGITTGYADGTFQPHKTVSRAEFVTFLWRYFGKPAASTGANPFVDVSDSSVFCPAILWAYGCGITTGYDETHFRPNQVCNRWQVVMFLYRAIGESKAYA